MNGNIKKVSVSFVIFIIINAIMIFGTVGNVLAIENKSINESVDRSLGPVLGSTDSTSELKASVSLHGEKTDVILGENIQIKLSAVNLITNPVMRVQVILIPPSGMSVTSSEFSKSGAGQFTTNYDLAPGDGKDIEIKIKANQIGNFDVTGRIIYYLGNETDKVEDSTQNLLIKVRGPLTPTNQKVNEKNEKISEKPKSPNYILDKNKIGAGYSGIVFTIIMFGLIVYMSYLLAKRMKKYK